MPIATTLATSRKKQPDEGALGFGQYFSDHMFLSEWESGAWRDARVVPYGPLSLDPAAGALHYGQAMFEGLKVFKQPNGKVAMFRADKHAKRMATGAPRLCMPPPDTDIFLEGAKALIRADLDWVPSAPGTALYLRPTLVATEGFLGVRPANNYLFFFIASPVGSYYGGGLRPVRIWVEREQTRASKGGIGASKAAANYVASLHASVRAKKAGYEQVLWLDGARHEYVEEVGTMNFFAVIGDELVTPPLSDSILAGVTRDSILQLAADLGIKVAERSLKLSELVDAHQAGKVKELFGSGSAAVVSPIGELALGDTEKLIIGGGEVGPIAHALYDEITSIQRGLKADRHGWLTPVD